MKCVECQFTGKGSNMYNISDGICLPRHINRMMVNVRHMLHNLRKYWAYRSVLIALTIIQKCIYRVTGTATELLSGETHILVVVIAL